MAKLDALRRTAPLVLSAGAPMDCARHLLRLRYRTSGGQTLWHWQSTFYEWCGTHYREISRDDIKSVVYRFLDGTCRKDDDDKLVPFNPTRSKVADVLDALAAVVQLPSTVRAPSWLDDTPGHDPRELLSCTNGLLHLPTRTLLSHAPTFFSLNTVEYPYDPSAAGPLEWLKFLGELWPDDPESIATLQELFGLLLTADTTHQKAFLIVGPTRSGKGTIARVLTALLGKENVVGPTLSSFSQNFGLAPLIGKPLAIISDARLGSRTDVNVIVERLLAITGEDSQTIDRKFRDPWNGQLLTRFLILTNELPKLNDASGALASRFIVWQLSKSFYGKEDRALTQRLLAERPAILSWALTGRDRLAARGYFVQPQSAQQIFDEIADLASPIGAFLRDRCETGPAHSIECDRLYAAWSIWCEEQHRDHPGTVQSFGRDLRAAVPALEIMQPREDGKRVRKYQGVGLKQSGLDTKQSAWSAPADGPPPGHLDHDSWYDDGRSAAW